MILAMDVSLENYKILKDLGYILNRECKQKAVKSLNGVNVLGFSSRFVFNVRVGEKSIKYVTKKQAAEFILLLNLGITCTKAMEIL